MSIDSFRELPALTIANGRIRYALILFQNLPKSFKTDPERQSGDLENAETPERNTHFINTTLARQRSGKAIEVSE